MKYKGLIEYPPYIDEVSKYLGLIRYEKNKLMPSFKDGNKGDRHQLFQEIGIKCELIFQHYLWTGGFDFESADLIQDEPDRSPDVVMDRMGFDVKGIQSGQHLFVVPETAHNKDKGIDIYVFIQLIDGRSAASIWVATYGEVSKWEQQNLVPEYKNKPYIKKIEF